ILFTALILSVVFDAKISGRMIWKKELFRGKKKRLAMRREMRIPQMWVLPGSNSGRVVAGFHSAA
ncbi:MAG: hypothetical protein DMF74_14435, partial [Acidobacteria bacterium]